jgi:hypothetical protein
MDTFDLTRAAIEKLEQSVARGDRQRLGIRFVDEYVPASGSPTREAYLSGLRGAALEEFASQEALSVHDNVPYKLVIDVCDSSCVAEADRFAVRGFLFLVPDSLMNRLEGVTLDFVGNDFEFVSSGVRYKSLTCVLRRNVG